MKLPALLTLILATAAGILEYLNQQVWTVGSWHPAITYGIMVITALGVTAAVGRQLGVDIAELLHLSPAVIAVLTTLAVVIPSLLTAVSVNGVARGIILGVAAFVTTIFGPGVAVAASRPQAATAAPPTV